MKDKENNRTYILSEKLDLKISSFSNRITKYKTKRTIKKHWNKELEFIIESISIKDIVKESEYYHKLKDNRYINLNTLTKIVTSYRATIKGMAIRNKTPEELIKYMLIDGENIGNKKYRGLVNVPIKLLDKRTNKISNSTIDRKRNPIKIESLKSIYDTCLKLLDSPVWYNKVIGLAFFTGRRFTEICKTGKLTKTKNNDVLIFRGQLKLKGGITNEGYTIPILHSNKVINALKELRAIQDYSHTHIDKVNNYSGFVNKKLREILGDSMGVHKLRSLYALTYDHYNNKNNIHKTTYIGDILGHNVDNGNNASEKYELVNISFDLNEETVKSIESIEYSYREIK